MGNISITTNINIIEPIISLYTVNIFIRRHRNIPEESIRNDINNVMSDYFISNERFDRVVKSDIIKTIKNNVPGVDSVNLDFICKKNEDYHRKNTRSTQRANPNYNSNTLLGIDPVQGDIIVEQEELCVLRGGWLDRKGIYYSDDVKSDGLSTINIFFTGIVDNKNF